MHNVLGFFKPIKTLQNKLVSWILIKEGNTRRQNMFTFTGTDKSLSSS